MGITAVMKTKRHKATRILQQSLHNSNLQHHIIIDNYGLVDIPCVHIRQVFVPEHDLWYDDL